MTHQDQPYLSSDALDANPHLSTDVDVLQRAIISLKNEVAEWRKKAAENDININTTLERKLSENLMLLRTIGDDYHAIINYMCLKDIVKDSEALQAQFDELFICLSLVISEEDYNKKLKETRLELYSKARK
jgi:hypothetical protein